MDSEVSYMRVSEKTKLVFSTNLDYLMKVTETGIPVSQRELAKNLEISQGAVSTWLLGQKFPRAETLRAIAKFFHVKVTDLTDDEFIEKHRKSILGEDGAEVMDALSVLEEALKFQNDDPFLYGDEILGFADALSEGTIEQRQDYYKQSVKAGGGDEMITNLVQIAVQLNDSGKAKVIEYARDLKDSSNYNALHHKPSLDSDE